MSRAPIIVFVAALSLAALAVWKLESQSSGLISEEITVQGTPVTIWRTHGDQSAPLAVIAHGYAGSRQMMQPIALSLARAGYAAASFDFLGHGRHDTPITADVTVIEGATAQLVEQTITVARALQARPDIDGPIGLVGHSMATDIVIRAARRLEQVAGVVAISMYSDAVTPQHPARLLVISGANESRLREIALDRVRQIDPTVEEGELARSGDVLRQSIFAPWVGHVGVLYSATTLDAAQRWLGTSSGNASWRGVWILMLLAAILALAWPLSRLIPTRSLPEPPPRGLVWRAILVAPLPAVGVAAAIPDSPYGLAGFSSLTGFLGVWGLVQIVVLFTSRTWQPVWTVSAAVMLLAWGLGIFASSLDHYGAAFLPVGPRAEIMAILLIGTLPFCLADSVLARGFSWLQRLTSRALVLVALLGAMLLSPGLGPAFTVLPVLVLFWLVYGLAAKWIVSRAGAEVPGLALGVILAWAIAASTPLIAT